MARRGSKQALMAPVPLSPVQQAESAVEVARRMTDFAEKALRGKINAVLAAVEEMGADARRAIAYTMDGWTEPTTGNAHAPDLPKASAYLQHHILWALANLGIDDLTQKSAEHLQAQTMLAQAERDLAALRAQQ